MNEHLMEALRRLRRSSSDTNVDRRLVTNVLLSFLTTPRADSKRFEMLSLLATILQWSDDDREKAGLQRSGGAQPPSGSLLWGGRSAASSPASKPAELQKTDETEVSRILSRGDLRAYTYSWCSHSLGYGSSFFSQKLQQARVLCHHHHAHHRDRTAHYLARLRKPTHGYRPPVSTAPDACLPSRLRWQALPSSNSLVYPQRARRKLYIDPFAARGTHIILLGIRKDFFLYAHIVHRSILHRPSLARVL